MANSATRWLVGVLLLSAAVGRAAEPVWLAEAVAAPDAAARARVLATHRDELTGALARRLARQAADQPAAEQAPALAAVAGDMAVLLKQDSLTGYVAMQRGWLLAARGQWREAAGAFEQGHAGQQAWADAAAACAAWRALCAQRLGEGAVMAEWLRRPVVGYAPLQQAVCAAATAQEGVVPGWADYQRGVVEEDQQRWPPAETAYRSAATQFEQAGVDLALAAALDRAGLVSTYQSKLGAATQLYARSLAAAKRCGDRYATGRAWLGFAEIAQDQADLERVVECAGKAAESFRDGDFFIDLARCYWLRAVARQNGGRHQEVEPELSQAEAWYRRAKSPGGVADCQFVRGFNWLLLGDRARAVAAFEAAGRTYHETGNYMGEANVRLKMAHATFIVGQYERSERYAREALALFRSVHDRLGEGNCLRALARLADQRGALDQAEQLYRDALAVARDVGDRLGSAAALSALGELQRRRDQDVNATIRTLLDSLELYQKIGDQYGAATVCLKLGDVLLRHGEGELARRALLKGLALAQASGARAAVAQACFYLGRFHEALATPQLEAAEQYYRMACDLVEQMRQRAGGQEAQQGLRREYMRYFEALARVLIRLGRAPEAFRVAEESHARTLLDMVVDAGVDLNAGLSADQRLEEQRLAGQLTQASLQLGRLLALPDAAAADVTRARAELLAAREASDRFREDLSLHQSDAAGRSRAAVAGADRLASMLPADTALLEYLVAEQQTYAFLVTRAGELRVRAVVLPLGEDRVAELCSQLRTACANPRMRTKQLAEQAAAALLEPVLKEAPAGLKRLVIVPDQALFELPFQVLPVEGGPLWERYDLVYACSATLLKQAREAPPAGGQGLLVFADPLFGPLVRSPDLQSSQPPEPLPGTAGEARELGRLFGDQAQVYQGRAAQEATAKAQMGNYRYVHFATHGVVDSASPLYSAVLLSEPAAGSGEDGALEAREIMGLKLKAELVVLSACETGLGKVQPGEGLLGLTWALTAAGARAQVVSQWRVSDEATQEFMTQFYSRLRAGDDKAAALRAAGRAVRAQQTHPFYWAPFVLVGSW